MQEAQVVVLWEPVSSYSYHMTKELGAAGRGAAGDAGVMVLQGRVAQELATTRLEHMLDTQARRSK